MLAQFSDQSLSPDLYEFDDDQHHHHKALTENANNQTMAVSRSPSLGRATNIYQPPEEAHHYSVITFKTAGYNSNLMHDTGSFLSFDQNDQQILQNTCPKISSSGHHHDYNSIWDENVVHDFINPKCASASGNLRLSQDFSCMQSTSPCGGEPFVWPNSERDATINGSSEDQLGTYREPSFNKRPHLGESAEQALKRQCSAIGATKKPKPKSTSTSKDPQSIAAKNRRERISERLKILQELVPNGSKVDLVTMLEKAISYVKFLQLQVKVLATDEFWPAQGGKAPDLSQVKEAIDVILSSQKDTNSSSK